MVSVFAPFQVHAYIIGHLRSEMPTLMGKDTKKRELIGRLPRIFEQLAQQHCISLGDFPKVDKMQEQLALQDFGTFLALSDRQIKTVDEMLSSDIAKLMQMIPKEQMPGSETHEMIVKGGAFDSQATPFGYMASEGFNKGRFDSGWVVEAERDEADKIFETLDPVGGKITGTSAREHMIKSRLPNAALRKIWTLSDVDKDGCLDADEFALTCYLMRLKLSGDELPSTLPMHLVPPAKRSMFTNGNGTATPKGSNEGEYEMATPVLNGNGSSRGSIADSSIGFQPY
ncbi:hypothetical protein Ciccas_013264 [Cichlidogyrus casuarinus]|uniref:Calmodulin n=1 Tax=Cichlidogyrus casuarinus TaxID=1844966 RepID=A0ABD2PMH7_9PLAT